MKLSARERQIIDLVLEGYLNINIAAKLAISEHTIKSHLQRIYIKLNIHGADKRQQLATVTSSGRD